MKYDVFISYSSKDQKKVEDICGYLEAQGIKCFVASRDIPRGVVWAGAIVDALEESSMMLVAFSESFNESKQVDREIELTSMDDKPILTFRLEDVKFKGAKKYYLQNLNWIDGFANTDSAYGELYSNICKLLGKEEYNEVIVPSSNNSDSGSDAQLNSELSEGNKTQAKGKSRKSKSQKQTNTIESQLAFDPNSGEFKLKYEEKTGVGFINGHEYVDLGLPSGLKWATCNVDASKPEEYGDYYQWGECWPKPIYDENNCNTCGRDKQWLRSNGYIAGRGKGALAPTHDVARVQWGGTWRMPTQKEIRELFDNTTSEWMARNGVAGRLFKSNKNGNYIFLPAAGWRCCRTNDDLGENGHYWSSSAFDGDYGSKTDNSYSLFFDSSTFFDARDLRYYGCSIRPVSE